MKKIFFATENKSKIKRFEKELLKKGIEIISINDIETKEEIIENGKSAIQNALIKARAYTKIIDIPILAIDDNLYIDSIPDTKQPGMYVRRVNGKYLTDMEMIEYYSNLAHEYGINGKLNCRWVYGLALIKDQNEYTYTYSKDDFYIIDKPSKKIDPGYPLNSISVNKKLNMYFSEITDDLKRDIKENENDVIDFICKNL